MNIIACQFNNIDPESCGENFIYYGFKYMEEVKRLACWTAGREGYSHSGTGYCRGWL